MPLPKKDQRPSALFWLTAVVSLALPIIGVVVAVGGIFRAAKGDATGWYWAGAGLAVIILDLLIDVLWGSPKVSQSDEPDLNRRGRELVGQIVIVADPIAPGGRGSVRAADTIWAAEGCTAARGAQVRVTGVKGTVLNVEPAEAQNLGG